MGKTTFRGQQADQIVKQDLKTLKTMQQQNKSNERSNRTQTNLSQLKSKLNELPLSERIKVLEKKETK
jgi:hypothetical protein